MRPEQERIRPAGNRADSGDLLAGDHRNDIAEPAAALFFRHSYAVLVRGKSVRRHLYFNLPAAERTVKRARERGDRADLVLVQLVPVDARSDGAA